MKRVQLLQFCDYQVKRARVPWFFLVCKIPQLLWGIPVARALLPPGTALGACGHTASAAVAQPPRGTAEGKVLGGEPQEKLALRANQTWIIRAFGHLLCWWIQEECSRSQSTGVCHLREHLPDFPSPLLPFHMLPNFLWLKVTGWGSHGSLFESFPNIARGDMSEWHEMYLPLFPSLPAPGKGLYNLISICCL